MCTITTMQVAFQMKVKGKSGFGGGPVVKNMPANARDKGDEGFIPRQEKFPGGGHGNPLQYSCWENPMDRGAWWSAFLWGHKRVRHD